jgi:hypothetical protein
MAVEMALPWMPFCVRCFVMLMNTPIFFAATACQSALPRAYVGKNLHAN